MQLYHKETLENGLRLVTAAMPHTRSVSIGFFIGAGSRYESNEEAGISHFIEHLCFKGTAERPTATEVCTVIEGVGGMINAGTDKELTIYWCKVAQPHFNVALEVMTDMLRNSLFAPEEIEKERQVIMEEINMSLDSPSQRVALLIDEILWPGHPLGRDIAGSRESVTGIDRNMLLDYMSRRYGPDNIVLVIAGNIRHREVVAAVRKYTSGWDSEKTDTGYLRYQGTAEQRVIIESRDTEQAHLCLALPGLSVVHPDRFKLDLLNVVLGEGMTSRLFTEIRDNLGLAYNIHSYTEHFLDTGAMTIAAGVDVKNLKVAVQSILAELARFKEVTPEKELTKARELFKGRILLRMEDSRNVAGWIGGQEILTGNILSVEEVVEAVESTTAEEIKQLAGRIFTGDRLRLAVVGPVNPDETLEELLEL
jgi:predicted Zn-dependent peptidase